MIFKSNVVKDYYNCTLNQINSEKMFNSVREWRRLLRSACRQLRAYLPLIKLGQQQQLLLAKFE